MQAKFPLATKQAAMQHKKAGDYLLVERFIPVFFSDKRLPRVKQYKSTRIADRFDVAGLMLRSIALKIKYCCKFQRLLLAPKFNRFG